MYEGPSTGPRVDSRGRWISLEEEPPAPRILEPGERVSFHALFQSRWPGRFPPKLDRPLFLDPGTFRVEWSVVLQFALGDEPVRSARLASAVREVRVLDPGPHKAALEALRALTEPNLVLEPGHVIHAVDRDPERLHEWDRELAGFLDEHDASPWAPMAWLARAHIASALGAAPDSAQFAAKSVKRARIYGILPVLRSAMATWLLALNELGDRDAAAQVREELRGLEGRRGQPESAAENRRNPEDEI